MSDGPHKSLSMHRGWKRVAERAANTSYGLDDVSQSIAPALEQDCRDQMSSEFLHALSALVRDQSQLRLPMDLNRDFESVRAIAGSGIEHTVLDNIALISAHDVATLDPIRAGLEAALRGRGACAVRQIEEHWLRSSKNKDASTVRARLDQAIERAPMQAIAEKLLGINAHPMERPSTYRGLDDGARL
jgi:hypothetical protein